MAYSWQSISSTDLAQKESLNSSRSDIAKLKNNIAYLVERFHTEEIVSYRPDKQFNVIDIGVVYPGGKATSQELIRWVQDLNALGEIQTCTSYNSTQYSSVCSTNYANCSNKGAQNAAQNSNYGENGNYSDYGNNTNDVDNKSE